MATLKNIIVSEAIISTRQTDTYTTMSDRLQQRVVSMTNATEIDSSIDHVITRLTQMLVPIKVLFKFLQLHATVQVWLFEQSDTRIQGTLVGFDEFMNVVLEDAVQISGDKERKIGKIMLKGDNITLISNMS